MITREKKENPVAHKSDVEDFNKNEIVFSIEYIFGFQLMTKRKKNSIKNLLKLNDLHY